MSTHDNFKFLGKFDTASFVEKVKTITEEEWNEFDLRQTIFEVHAATRTIPLLFNVDFSQPPLPYKFYDLFEDDVKKLEAFFTEWYGNGEMSRCIMVSLLAKSTVPVHVDNGEHLIKSHRHHIPLITNEAVIFQIGLERKNMKVGEIWEINNRTLHGLSNTSTERRIHIIADWQTEDRIVLDKT